MNPSARGRSWCRAAGERGSRSVRNSAADRTRRRLCLSGDASRADDRNPGRYRTTIRAMTMSSSRLLAGCLVAAVLVTSPAQAQNVEQNPRVRQAIRLLEIWLDAQRDYEQIPGLSVAVVHDQDVVWKGAYGFADLSKKDAGEPGHDLQHLLDLEAVHQYRRHAAARCRQAATRRPGRETSPMVHDQSDGS